MRDLYRTPDGEERVRAWCRARLADWAFPHRAHVLSTSLGDTHVVEAGTGDSVCVYLPGTNFNGSTSLGLLERLATRCRVVVPDLPGQPGLSDGRRPRDEADAYGRWMSEVLTWVRGEWRDVPVTVAAHSRGAAVALAGPVDVASLVLVSPAGLVGVRVGANVLRVTLPWLVRPTESRSHELLRLMSGPTAQPDPALVTWLTLVARDTRTTGAPGPLPDGTLRRWHGVPVRVLVGQHDCFFPARKLRRAAVAHLGEGVEAEVLSGLGHLAVDEAPEMVASLITRHRGSTRR